MECVCRFLKWQEEDWSAKGDSSHWPGISEVRAEALQAYASRQATLRWTLQSHFDSLWDTLPAHILLMRSAIDDPNILQEFKDNELEEGADGNRRKKRRG